MPSKAEVSIDSLVTALSNEKVIESLSKMFQPLIQSAVTSAIDKLNQELKMRDDIISHLQKENVELKTKVYRQSQYMEQLETYSKQENLIINGLPTVLSETVASSGQSTESDVQVIHESSSTTETAFLKLCSSRLGVDVKSSDISICHRLKKKDNMQYPPVIVRFTNRKTREAVLAARRKLKPTSSSDRESRIFIGEHLTHNASKIHATARRLVREKKLLQTWTRHGHVVIKLLDNHVKTVSSLSELDAY